MGNSCRYKNTLRLDVKILSIDIDYAYSPTISIYDDFIEGSRISLEEQAKIIKEKNLPEPKINLTKLDFLKSVVKEKTDENTPIVIADTHDKILNFLPKETSIIYNIDHHHDIYYPGWHSIDELDEGNWVSFLRKTKLKEYNWIRNIDSENYEADIKLDFVFNELYLDNVETLPRFDFVFCCSSMHWTGKSGRKYLFEVLGATNEL